MMTISTPLLNGMIAGELITTNLAIIIPVCHGMNELRPAISAKGLLVIDPE